MFVAILVNMNHSNRGFYWNMNTDPIIEKLVPSCDGARVGIWLFHNLLNQLLKFMLDHVFVFLPALNT